jgi:hypothetical protein
MVKSKLITGHPTLMDFRAYNQRYSDVIRFLVLDLRSMKIKFTEMVKSESCFSLQSTVVPSERTTTVYVNSTNLTE